MCSSEVGGEVVGGGGERSLNVMYFFKNLLLYSGVWFIQTKCVVLMTVEGFTKIVIFMTPGAGAWSYKWYSENAF